jgi:hypothetical protein
MSSPYYINNTNSPLDLSNLGNQGYNYYFIDASAGDINILMPASLQVNGGFDGLYFQFSRIDNSGYTVTFTQYTAGTPETFILCGSGSETSTTLATGQGACLDTFNQVTYLQLF